MVYWYCFTGTEDRATLRSDLSAVLGLREGGAKCCAAFFFLLQRVALLETKAQNLGGQGAEPPLIGFRFSVFDIFKRVDACTDVLVVLVWSKHR